MPTCLSPSLLPSPSETPPSLLPSPSETPPSPLPFPPPCLTLRNPSPCSAPPPCPHSPPCPFLLLALTLGDRSLPLALTVKTLSLSPCPYLHPRKPLSPLLPPSSPTHLSARCVAAGLPCDKCFASAHASSRLVWKTHCLLALGSHDWRHNHVTLT